MHVRCSKWLTDADRIMAGAGLRLDLMDTGAGAGTDMSSYWDYMKQNWYYGPSSFIKSAYDVAYDDAHGSTKYWLSKVPIYGQLRKWKDEAQSWQDTYNNTGQDPTYSTSYGNSNPAAAVAGMVGGAAGLTKMVFSLTEMYSAEVVADVGYNVNRPMFG